MVFPMVSNNRSLSINPNIGYVLNRRINNPTNTCWIPLWKQIYSQVNTSYTQVMKYFSACHSTHPVHTSAEDKLNVLPIHKILSEFFGKDPNLLSRKYSTFCTKIETSRYTHTQIILFNKKSQHLFNQIRSFKSGRLTEHESKGVTDRIKRFWGFSDIKSTDKSHVRKDLDLFHNNISKENLTPEQSQRVMLAFTEWYMLAKGNLANEKSRFWFPPYYIVGGLLKGIFFISLLYIFSANSSISDIFKNSTLTSVEVIESNVKFSDVKGAEEAKQELKNVVEFLKNPEKFSALGGKLPNGVLLVGPPGTGKTLLAKAVAGEAGVPFFSTSGAEFDEIFVGVGAKRIRDLFKIAKENIPCVIFIDEIDSIGKERTSSSLHPHANDTINQLLSEMDGFRNSNGIIVLGATNRREDLDKALLRPGRFDVEVTVLVPDFTGRKELLEFYLSRVHHQQIDVEKLARGTANFTGADIENIVNQAALRAAVVGASFVTMEHLEYARDKALMGPESISRITDEETNRITAYHEGGHTVVAYFTEHSQPLHKVTIIARGSSLGHTAYIPDKDIYHITKNQLLAMLDSMMGGRAAEELIFGSEKITSGASSDLEKATELASKMVKRWGMSEAVGLQTYSNHTFISAQTANLIDMEIKKILQESYERAKSILITHKDKHRELSEALLKYETLNADEITAIMKGDKNFRSRLENK